MKTAVNPQVRAGTGSTPAAAAGRRGASSVPPVTTVTVKVAQGQPGRARQAAGGQGSPGRPGKPAGAVTRNSLAGQGTGASTAPDPSSAPPPAAGGRARVKPLTPMRQDAARKMRLLAAKAQASHPDLSVHEHLRDAAKVLESGNEEGAQRHLRAAMFALTPQSLMRNGLHTDEHHMGAREVMHGVHRHLLAVKDITDARSQNEERAMSARQANAGYGPGALAQAPTARQPLGNQALNAPGRLPTGGPNASVADPNAPQRPGSRQFSWDDLAEIILSAETGRLAVTPAPRGKPGGPGLYHVKGNMHSPYMQNIVKALIEKRGMDPHRAYAIAWGAMRRWASGKGKVHPEVRAAAAGGLGLEKAAEARAHGHAVTWDDVAGSIELSLAWLHEKRGKGGKWTAGDAEKIVSAIGAANSRHDKTDVADRSQRGRDWALGQASSHVRQGNFSEAAKWTDKLAEQHPDPRSAAELRVISAGLRASAGGVTPSPRQQVAPPRISAFAQPATWDALAEAVELVGPHGYVHGWKFVGIPTAKIPASDKAMVSQHQADERATAMHAMSAAPGSHGHAQELRALAEEAQTGAGRNYLSLKDSREGPPPEPVARLKAGMDPGDRGPQESDASRALNRAATMIDRGQPSLARLHSGFIREAAASEATGDPAFKARLNAAADKLDQLPKRSGLGKQPPVTADFRARSAAAVSYARSQGLASPRAGAWDDLATAVELAATAPAPSAGTGGGQQRVAAGQAGGGEFGSGGGQPAAAPTPAQKAQQKLALIDQAQGYRQQADALIKQRDALRAQLASASGKTSKGQSGSTTSGQSGSTTKSSSASTTSSSGSTTGSGASTTSSGASTTSSAGSTTSSSSKASAAPGSAAAAASTAQINSQISALNTQITSLQAKYKATMAQAAAL